MSTSSAPSTPSSSSIKLLCSFGGRILPRPADGALRHAGGDTRIVTIPRSATLPSFIGRLSDAFSQPGGFSVRYQLPGEPLDAGLISVSTADDLENMFDELEKLPADAKLRLFLFPTSDPAAGPSPQFDAPEVEYLEAVNGIVRRADSFASLASTPAVNAASLSPSMLSPTSSEASHAPLAPLVDLESSPKQPHSPVLAGVGTAFEQISISSNEGGNDVASAAAAAAEERRGNDEGKEMKYKQPLSQLPPLQPMFMNREGYAPMGDPLIVGNNNCNMCMKELPHAHSDPVVTEYVPEGNSGPVSPEPSQPVFLSLRPVDIERIMAQERAMAAQRGAYGINPVPGVPHGVEGAVPAGSVYPVYVGHVNPYQQEYLQHHLLQQQQLPMGYGVPHYPVRQDVGGNAFYVDGSVRANAKIHEESQHLQGNLQPVYVPTYAHQPDLMMEQLRSSPTEASSTSEFGRQVVSPESVATSQNVPLDHTQKIPDSSYVAVPDGQPKEMPLTSTFFELPEQSPFAPTEPLSAPAMARVYHTEKKIAVQDSLASAGTTSPHFLEQKIVPSTEAVTPVPMSYLHTLNPLSVNHIMGMVGPNGVYPSYGTTVGSHAIPQGYDVNHVYASTAINAGINRIDVPVVNQLKEFHKESAAAPSDSMLPTNSSRYPASIDQMQQPVVANTPQAAVLPAQQLSKEDPWKALDSAAQLPPKPKKVAGSSPREAFPANGLLTSKLPDMNIPLEAAQPELSNKDLYADPIYVTKGDEAATDVLLSVEENVVAPSHHVAETQTNSVGQDHLDLLDDGGPESDKLDGENHGPEVSKNRPADWIAPGFALTDDFGHLQIIKNSDLEELKELGSGTFGTVFHGKWRGTDVAIKRINERCFAGKQSEQERMRSDFWNEASKLSELHHPNVVAFYGVVLDGPGGSIATVTEFMVNGSLRSALLKNTKSLDRRKRLILAMDAAFGMEYLHSKNIVHFDLKSDNLLVNLRDPHRPICKVADLGLSKVKCQTMISGGVRGTLPWMAPELLSGTNSFVTEKVDVFSFGIVLWELLTGEEPYADLHYGNIIGGIVNNTLRPTIPESCDPDWRTLMEHCWTTEPSERPTFTEIASRLRAMTSAPQKTQH